MPEQIIDGFNKNGALLAIDASGNIAVSGIVTVFGRNTKAIGSIVRINNTTQYSVGDVINGSNLTTPIRFNVASASNKNGWIVGGRAITDKSGTTLPSIDLNLYNVTSGIPADNALWGGPYELEKNYIGKVRFQVWIAHASGAKSDGAVETAIQFTPETGSTFIYGVPMAQNTYTPASAENLMFMLDAEQY